MNSYVELLIRKFQAKGLMIDANLLLLYLVGSYDLRLVWGRQIQQAIEL